MPGFEFFQFLGNGPRQEAIASTIRMFKIGTWHFLKLHESIYQNQDFPLSMLYRVLTNRGSYQTGENSKK